MISEASRLASRRGSPMSFLAINIKSKEAVYPQCLYKHILASQDPTCHVIGIYSSYKLPSANLTHIANLDCRMYRRLPSSSGGYKYQISLHLVTLLENFSTTDIKAATPSFISSASAENPIIGIDVFFNFRGKTCFSALLKPQVSGKVF